MVHSSAQRELPAQHGALMGSSAKKKGTKFKAGEHDPRELLAPILGLLLRSGLGEKKIREQFDRALSAAKRERSGPQVYRVQSKYLSADLLHRWMRDPKYLNSNGKPVDLPAQGETSIASLVKESAISGSPETIVPFLLKFENVRRTRDGKFRLLRRSLNYKIPDLLPFEPNFEFLVDAARSCTRGIGLPKRSQDLFWQRADSLRLDPAQAKGFLEFAETRGMLFMHEMNDWLDQRAGANDQKRKRSLKVGVGYFGICRSI